VLERSIGLGLARFLLCSLLGNVLTVAGTVNVDADGEHREAIEDSHRDGVVAEVVAPFAELDVRGDGGSDLAMPAVDQVEEGVGGGGLVVALFDLSEADVIDDEQLGLRPRLEASGVGSVGEASVQVVEQVDAPSIAHRELLLAGASGEGLQDVALTGSARAGDDQIVAPSHEVEASELGNEGLVEGGLEIPVEGRERLVFFEATDLDAPCDAAFELVRRLSAEGALEECGRTRALAKRPRE
jgi:hypothetical protein